MGLACTQAVFWEAARERCRVVQVRAWPCRFHLFGMFSAAKKNDRRICCFCNGRHAKPQRITRAVRTPSQSGVYACENLRSRSVASIPRSMRADNNNGRVLNLLACTQRSLCLRLQDRPCVGWRRCGLHGSGCARHGSEIPPRLLVALSW